MSTAVAGYKRSFGSDGPPGAYEDFERADVVILIGANIAENHPILCQRLAANRNGTLIGAIGVSGDGVDQDDMIAFLGLHNAGQALGGALGNAPADRRADTVIAQGVRLRYVQCPQAPFIDSSDDNVCDGK